MMHSYFIPIGQATGSSVANFYNEVLENDSFICMELPDNLLMP
jgi:transcriptional regulatory protein LevR